MVEKKTLGKGTEQVIRKTIKELEKERGNSLPNDDDVAFILSSYH